MSRILTLWLPDLLTDKKINEADENAHSFSKLNLPSLKKLLSKADVFPVKEGDFYHQAGVLCHQTESFPVACTTASIDLSEFDPNAFWLRVDPVQLVPDRDTLVLLPSQHLNITLEEAIALVSAFNDHFAQDQVQIEMSSPNRWYLKVLQPVDIQTSPLEKAAWQSVDLNMPTGHAEQYWRQLINETQMLFYGHAVNERRREQGLPEINSVWIWGEGCLSGSQISQLGLKAHSDWTVYSSHVYLQGMSQLMGANCEETPENYQAWLNAQPTERSVIMPDNVFQKNAELSLEGWLSVIEWLEEDWLQPLEVALKTKQLDSLLLDFGSGQRFHLTPKHLSKFWRLPKSISKSLSKPLS